MKKFFIISLIFLFIKDNAQILITAPNYTYTETFGAAGPAGWTDNVSYTGWYYNSSNGNYGGFLNLTGPSPSNTGGLYTYECNNGNDVKLGSRASGGTNSIRYGMRVRNNTAFAVNSIQVSYDFFQFSLAENGNNVNTITFSYLVAATANNLLAGGYTNVAALDYSQLQNSATCGGAQINGFACTQSGSKAVTCIAVTIPAGQEIMLRWTDVDDGCNDHHMAIDNVRVIFFTNQTVGGNTACSPLPITLSDFYARADQTSVSLYWNVATELNVDHYLIEKSKDGENFTLVDKKNSLSETEGKYNLNYSAIDPNPYAGINYYRLTNVDVDKSKHQHQIIMVNYNAANTANVWISQNETEIIVSHKPEFKNKQFYIMDMQGKLIGNYYNQSNDLNYFTIKKSTLAQGLCVFGCNDAAIPPQKLLIN